MSSTERDFVLLFLAYEHIEKSPVCKAVQALVQHRKENTSVHDISGLNATDHQCQQNNPLQGQAVAENTDLRPCQEGEMPSLVPGIARTGWQPTPGLPPYAVAGHNHLYNFQSYATPYVAWGSSGPWYYPNVLPLPHPGPILSPPVNHHSIGTMYGTSPTLPGHNDAALEHQNTPLRAQAVVGEGYPNAPLVGAKRLREELVDPIASPPTSNVNICPTQAPLEFDMIFEEFLRTAGDGTSTPVSRNSASM